MSVSYAHFCFYNKIFVFYKCMELTDNEIKQNKEKIIELLKSIGRDNTYALLDFLNRSGYYYLYGSFKHHTYKGGLAQHSLEVMDYALENNRNCDRDSIIISSLLHDLCKTKYEFPEGVEFEGHGTKSLGIIKDFIKYPLTYDEENAIRFHMGGKCFIRNEEEKKKYKDANNSELWNLVHTGDCISAGHYTGFSKGIAKGLIKMLK